MGHEAETLRRRNRELSILNSIAQALNQSVQIEDALQAVLAAVAELLELTSGWIWLFHDGTVSSYLAASQNLPPVLQKYPEKMRGSCYCLSTFREGDMAGAANVNVVECSRLAGVVTGTDGLLYHASIPLYAHGKKLGVMNVASADWRELSTEDLQLLYTIGDMLGIAVERARLFDQSVRLGALEERNRLAREIHDTLAQGLTAVSLQLESADALLDSDAPPEKVQSAVQQALMLTRANLAEARRSVLDLRARPLQNKSLPQALMQLVKEREFPFTVQLALDVPSLPPGIETGLYRIVQEALTNAARHASAATVVVQLAQLDDVLTLTIRDDGVGFDPKAIPTDRFGLISMRERANLLNGSLQIDTTAGQGTQIRVTIPL